MSHNGIRILSSFCENNSFLFYVYLCVYEFLMNMFTEEKNPIQNELHANEIKYNLILLCKLYKIAIKVWSFYAN